MPASKKKALAMSPEPVDELRIIFNDRRLEPSSFGRMAHRILLTGLWSGAPSKALVVELCRLNLQHMLPLLAETWRLFSDELTDLSAWIPEPTPIKGKISKPAPSPWTFRQDGEPFRNVYEVGPRFLARVCGQALGRFDSAEAAASAVDSWTRSNRQKGFLNFRTSLDSSNSTQIVIEKAA